MARDNSREQPYFHEGPNRQKVVLALGEAGSVPSKFQERFREPYTGFKATVFLPRIAYFDSFNGYDHETQKPLVTTTDNRGAIRKKTLPDLYTDESAIQKPEDVAASLRTLDSAAEALTGFFLNGGVMGREFVVADSELGIEVLRHNFGANSGNLIPILDTDPRLRNSGYIIEPERDRFGEPYPNSVTVLFPEVAKDLSYERGAKFRIPPSFDAGYFAVPDEGYDRSMGGFWVRLSEVVKDIVINGELGQNGWSVRTLENDRIEEHYHYKSAVHMLMEDVLADIVNAKPGLCPQRPFLPLTALRKLFSRSPKS